MPPPIPTVVMVAAPLLLDDMSLSGASTVEVLRLVRTFRELEQTIDEVPPTVVVIDTDLTDDRGFEAMRAGAHGFIPIDAPPEEFDDVIRHVELGEPWLSAARSRSILAAVADDLQVTRADREAQLRNFVFGGCTTTGGSDGIGAPTTTPSRSSSGPTATSHIGRRGSRPGRRIRV